MKLLNKIFALHVSFFTLRVHSPTLGTIRLVDLKKYCLLFCEPYRMCPYPSNKGRRESDWFLSTSAGGVMLIIADGKSQVNPHITGTSINNLLHTKTII